MEAQDFRSLTEAYYQIYSEPEISEEAMIAADYFYEQGLNEDGVEILIDELGLNEFYEWVYDIVESYDLMEARRSGRIEPVTKTGKPISQLKGGAKSAAIRRLRSEKEKSRGHEGTEGPSDLRAALRSQAATVAASKQKETPRTEKPSETQRGIGGLIGSLIQRGQQDIGLLGKSIETARGVAARRGAEVKAVYDTLRQKGREMEQSPQATRARRQATVATGRAAQAAGRTAIRAAGAAGAAAGEGVKAHREGKSRAQIAGRAAGTFVKKMTQEDLEYILDYLLDEGFANSYEAAESIMENMSTDWAFEILSEAPFQIYGPPKGGSSDAEKVPLGKPYNFDPNDPESRRKARRRAKTRADKLDQEIGGYRHSVREIP